MTIIEFINFVLYEITGDTILFEMPDLVEYISSITNWTQFLNPMCLCSVIAYVGAFVFVWSFCFVLPYRFIKRLIGFPSRKGSEK